MQDIEQVRPYSVVMYEQPCRHYVIDMFGAIESFDQITDMLAALAQAEEHDTVTIRLNSEGGNVDIGDAVIVAMNNCKAPIHIEGSGCIASFATFVLLSADSFEISPFTSILCHSASLFMGGKMSDTKQHINFFYNQSEKMLKHFYTGFFDDEEIDRILKGYEHWMDADEFIERFKKRQEFLEQQISLDKNP